MPTYEYRCLDCHNEYEKREGFDALALQECPTCGGTARRVLHAASIVFKGSGFYVTDSRKPAPAGEKSAPAAEAEAKVESSKPAKDGGSAEAGKSSKDAEAAVGAVPGG